MWVLWRSLSVGASLFVGLGGSSLVLGLGSTLLEVAVESEQGRSKEPPRGASPLLPKVPNKWSSSTTDRGVVAGRPSIGGVSSLS